MNDNEGRSKLYLDCPGAGPMSSSAASKE